MTTNNMTIDQAYQALQKIVNEFEDNGMDLEKSLPRFKEGLKLAEYLKKRLTELKVEIEEIKGEFEKIDKVE